MSQYTKSTNFATKDNLPTGDPLKIVKGTEINTEFDNISTAIASNLELMVFGALIIFFLIVEPHGLARLWQIAKEKLRLWPFPH
jgi:hypothetical protein